jgi:hypothetical protein
MSDKTYRHRRDPDNVGLAISPSQLWQATLSIFTSGSDAATACTVLMAALTAIDHNNGAIQLNKKKLARSLNHPLELIETAMSDLAAIGVFYYSQLGRKSFDHLCMNPRIAWTGTDQDRAFWMRITHPLLEIPRCLSDRSIW